MNNLDLINRIQSTIDLVQSTIDLIMQELAAEQVPASPVPPTSTASLEISPLCRPEDATWSTQWPAQQKLAPIYLVKALKEKSILDFEKAWKLKPVRTVNPSYDGARVGDWLDICEPADKFEAGNVYVVLNTDATKPKTQFPILMELVGWYLTQCLGNPDGKGDIQASHTRQAVALLKQFGITPYKHWVNASVTDAIYRESDNERPVIVPLNLSSTIAQMKAVQADNVARGIKTPVCYIMDEPSTTDFPKIIGQAKLIRQYAPSVKILLTTEWNASLAPYIDLFVPVMDYFNNAIPDGKYHPEKAKYVNPFGLYTSNMAHGAWGSKSSGVPDLVIDRSLDWARFFPVAAWAMGASFALYYNTVEAWSTGDPMNHLDIFGGNGDGTLLYPGPNNTILPSLRLFGILQGLYDIDTLTAKDYKPGTLTKATEWQTLIPLVGA